jgi:2,5-diamino-6-(ribosylamino)-4(3H)-pyrimidinone 5'-phosphate reductase
VVKDDPSLRVHWELLGEPAGRNPMRVIVDASGRTPTNARVLDGSTPTIVATSERSTRAFPPHVSTIVCGATRVDLGRLFRELAERGVRRLMVEGGAEVLSSVLRGNLFDRFSIYYAPVIIGGSSSPPTVSGPDTHGPEELTTLELLSVERLGTGILATYGPSGRRGPLPEPW